MNTVLSFLQEVITGVSVNQKPIGLTSFKESDTKKVYIKNKKNNNEIKISDLMRKH